MIFRGKCNNVNNYLLLELSLFNIDYNNVSIEPVYMEMNKIFGSGNKFFWHQELSLIKSIIKGEKEFVLKASTTVPGSWNNVSINICLE